MADIHDQKHRDLAMYLLEVTIVIKFLLRKITFLKKIRSLKSRKKEEKRK